MLHGVSIDTRTSTSRSRPIRPRSIASLTASIIGEKRSWKLTAALSLRSRQTSRILVASSRSEPIGFWIRTRRAGRHALEHGEMRGRRRREIEDRALDPKRFVERMRRPYAECFADHLRSLSVEVEHAGDREPALPIGGEMRIDDDRASADGDDRHRPRRRGPGLAKGGRVEGHRAFMGLDHMFA